MTTEHVTLSASTVRTVSLSHGDPVTDAIADAPDRILIPGMQHLEVMNVDGDGVIYFTYGFGGGFEAAASAGAAPATPTIAGPDTTVVPAVEGAWVRIEAPSERNVVVVRLISAGTPDVAISTTTGERGEEESGTPGTGGGIVDFATTYYGVGNITLIDSGGVWTAWQTLPTLTVDASAGDIIGVKMNAIGFGLQCFIDVATVITPGTAINRLSNGASGFGGGLGGWYHTPDHSANGGPLGGTVDYEVQAEDLSGGTVTVQMFYQNDNNVAINTGVTFSVINYGQPA